MTKNFLFAAFLSLNAAAAAAAAPAGGIAWLEIRAVDVARTQAFYSSMFGWTFIPAGPDAVLFAAPNIEGMINKEAGHVPGHASMTAYIKVDKVKAACDKAVKLGAALAVTPRPIPGKGSFCVVTDTEQNRLGLLSDEKQP